MFDTLTDRIDALVLDQGPESAFERELGRFLAELSEPDPGSLLSTPRPVHPWLGRLGQTSATTPGDGDAVPGPLASALAEVGRAADRGAAHLQAAVGAHVAAARAAAEQAEALAAFAACRPQSMDLPDGAVGAAAAATRAARPAALTTVSEWAADEVAVALRMDRRAATAVLAESLVLVHRLPRTLQALRAGEIGWRHAQVMIDLVGPMADHVRAVAEERLLSRLGGKTPTQLRAAARRLVQRLDPGALADRMAAALRERRVSLYPGEDGMSGLYALLPTPVARACHSALERYAEACAVPGDTRTKDQRMADCLVDLLLRPGEHGLAPVQAQLTIVASVRTLLGGDEPGEVGGDLVPALMVRELAYALGLLPRPAARDDDPDRTPPAPRTASDGRAADDVQQLGALIGTDRPSGTALAHRPHVAVVDELTGQLLALTNATELRRAAWCGRTACRAGRCAHLDGGAGLGPPAGSAGYRPGEQLQRFVRLRDRRCRFPGCRARPIRCDTDHTVPWPQGPTRHDNLCCLCRHHHRLSHQAPGWRLRRLPDGGLSWTTPSGITAVTHPPSYGTDDDLPPPGPADDPPPF